jgi:hypothetical protein
MPLDLFEKGFDLAIPQAPLEVRRVPLSGKPAKEDDSSGPLWIGRGEENAQRSAFR